MPTGEQKGIGMRLVDRMPVKQQKNGFLTYGGNGALVIQARSSERGYL